MRKIKRNFPSKDAYMLEVASVMHAIFVDDLAEFTAFDTELDMNFALDWKAKIDAAYNFTSYSQINSIQAQKTESLASIMSKCRLKYKEMKFFAYKTFTVNDRRREAFGIKEYTKASRNYIAMLVLMETLYLTALEYKIALIANGLTATDIEEIKTLSNQLLEATTTRNNYMKVKKTLSNERVKALNECYATTRTVMDAAMLVYHNDFARSKAYVYWQGKHRKYA